jgi:crotonobetaine/carnitine-CoA ligase
MDAFPTTIPALLTRLAERPGPWLHFETDTWTGADVLARAREAAAALAERGVRRGDRIALLLGNSPDMLLAWFGVSLLGAIAVPVNPAYKPPELARLCGHAEPRVLISSAELRELAESGAGQVAAPPTLLGPADLRGHGSEAGVDVQPEEVATLIYTSGTTGLPKAVMQTHRTYALTAEAFPWWLGLTSDDRLLIALPLFHINAQAYSTMGALGAQLPLILLPRFSASRFWDDTRRYGATQFNAVGALVHILLKGEPRPDDRENPIRLCYSALALPEAQHRAFEERFGLTMSVGYGLSECTFGTVWPRGQAPCYGSMGVLRQHPRLGEINQGRVVRDDGLPAPDGEAGELLLRNPAVTPGYWHDPGATAAAIEDGWLRTGDLVRRDADGFLTFVARKKEVIRRRGENVAAAEVEAVLLEHPSIREAAVIGAPSDLGEEEIVAFVAPQPGESVDVEGLRAFVRERLADFKVPSRVEVRDGLPRTATERVAKHLLK